MQRLHSNAIIASTQEVSHTNFMRAPASGSQTAVIAARLRHAWFMHTERARQGLEPLLNHISIGRAIGQGRSVVSRMFTGDRTIAVEEIPIIAAMLKVSPSWLAWGDEAAVNGPPSPVISGDDEETSQSVGEPSQRGSSPRRRPA